MDGVWHTDHCNMERIILEYYDQLFASQQPTEQDFSPVLDCVQPCVTDSMNALLDKHFTYDEVKKAVFDLSPSKAPGPDGFPVVFFQSSWETVQREVVDHALVVVNSVASLDTWNNIVISLIPKVKKPTTLKDYRPISLCNVSYKIVARAFTNHF